MTDKILFCKIRPMKYYKGICNNDPAPEDSGEQYNFNPVIKDGKIYCYGYFEHRCQNLHIEKISDCEILENDKLGIKNVTVVWCANSKDGLVVVGWYKNATAYYEMQKFHNIQQNQWYYVTAEAKDCVLLPDNVRNNWKLPDNFTFGERFVRFINDSNYTNNINNLINNINNYEVNNWILKYPDKIKGE